MQVKKLIIGIIIFILAYIVLNLIISNSVQAVTQVISTDINGIDEQRYPGIKQMIQSLQQSHPNWKFKVLYTGIDWKEVIAYEYMGHEGSPKNLVPVTSKCTGDWVCLSCGENRYYDNGSWRCASETAIQYMMDARNSVNNSDVFQFMELTYQEASFENIKQMVQGTFLDKDSYINSIISAGKNYNVSPYYIVALAIQEQGTNGSSTVSGTYPGYEGYYNIFNINASGNDQGTIITRALSYAKDNGWNTLEASIDGGVKKISTSYIARGQNTLYLQKFDVDNSDNKMYWHQYQQNILAAQNEGVKIRQTFEKINSIDSAYTFIIPVYENMPTKVQGKPSTTKTINTLITDLVRVNVISSISLRSSPAGTKISAKLYSNEIVTRLEKATQKVQNTYWDKIMKSDGTIAYVARETYDYESEYKLYLIQVAELNQNWNDNQGGSIDTQPEDPEPEIPEGPDLISASNEKIKIDAENKQITIIPETTIQEIMNLAGVEITATDINGKTLEKTSIPGTGSKINGKYIIVMIGDANGDGTINSGDLFAVQKHLIQNTQVNIYTKTSMDANKDGAINSGDLFTIQKHLLGKGNLTIN